MKYWIWLKNVNGLGPVLGKRLVNKFKTPEAIYHASESELLSVAGIGTRLSKSIMLSRSLDTAESLMEKVDSAGASILTYSDPLYPKFAKNCPESPVMYYYRGTIKENFEGVGVVGARRCSDYGKKISIEVGEYLAHRNIPLVSGMAKGVDSYAQISCLKKGGYTVAFLGNGLDICYPSEHHSLMEEIAESGALISEHPFGVKPRGEFFIRRNAFISSWCKKLLVVESSKDGGSLITANFSKKYSRELLVPPHDIYKSEGAGSNKLLMEGATPYLFPEQLDDCHGTDQSPTRMIAKSQNSVIQTSSNSEEDMSSIEKFVLECLKSSPKSIDQLAFESGKTSSEVMEAVSALEFREKVKFVGGGNFGAI